jgi:hypothetical protein
VEYERTTRLPDENCELDYYVETLIATDHPIRVMKRICDEVPWFMCRHCGRNYAKNGTPSISLETLLKERTGSIPCGITTTFWQPAR